MADETQWDECLEATVEAITDLDLDGLATEEDGSGGGGVHKRRQCIRGDRLDSNLPLVVVSPEGMVEYRHRDSEDGVWRGWPVVVSIARASDRKAATDMETNPEWATLIEKAVTGITRVALPLLRGHAEVLEPSSEFQKAAQQAGYDLTTLRFRFWMRGTSK